MAVDTADMKAKDQEIGDLRAGYQPPEREFFVDNLLVRIHFILVMIRWTSAQVMSPTLSCEPSFFFFVITLKPRVEGYKSLSLKYELSSEQISRGWRMRCVARTATSSASTRSGASTRPLTTRRTIFSRSTGCSPHSGIRRFVWSDSPLTVGTSLYPCGIVYRRVWIIVLPSPGPERSERTTQDAAGRGVGAFLYVPYSLDCGSTVLYVPFDAT